MWGTNATVCSIHDKISSARPGGRVGWGRATHPGGVTIGRIGAASRGGLGSTGQLSQYIAVPSDLYLSLAGWVRLW